MPPKKKLNPKLQKMLKQVLEDPKTGFLKLGAALANPVRQRLDHVSLARLVCEVNPVLRPGQLKVYPTNGKTIYYIREDQRVGTRVLEQHIAVLFELVSEVKFNIATVTKLPDQLAAGLADQETEYLGKLLKVAAENNEIIIGTSFKIPENKEFETVVLAHPTAAKKIKYDGQVHRTYEMPKNMAFVVPVGACKLDIRIDVEVIPATNERSEARLVAYELISMTLPQTTALKAYKVEGK